MDLVNNVLAVMLGTFVPVFVAMDPVGALPMILSWTGGMPARDTRRQLRAALLTAFLIGMLFLTGGEGLLRLLGIGIPDFLISGGLVLLVLAVSDLVLGGGHESRGTSSRPDFGVVPIGTPILAGPATLSTLLVLQSQYGGVVVALALTANLIVAWALFRQAGNITKLFGRNGLRAMSKVVSLLLAAIAVHYIRAGIVAVLSAGIP
jgi:multiple antibiotic resistance protein